MESSWAETNQASSPLNYMEEKKPYLVAFLYQFISASMFILSKAALNEGMNSFVFMFYRQLAGSIVLIAVMIFKW